MVVYCLQVGLYGHGLNLVTSNDLANQFQKLISICTSLHLTTMETYTNVQLHA